MDQISPSPGQTPQSSTPPRRPRRSGRQPPPRWLMAVLSLCLALIVIASATRAFRPGETPGAAAAAAEDTTKAAIPTSAVAATPSAAPTAAPTPEPAPTPEASAAAAAEPTQPPVQSETEDMLACAEAPPPRETVTPTDSGSWFSDAVFIGDSRVAGLRLYSGITLEAAFLDHTGLTVYEVKEGKKVIRRGDRKISVLDALAEGVYGKVYIALGVNELGYFNPKGFAEACGEVVEAIREKQPGARVFLQSLIPVNTAKCKANDIPYYITNEGVASYNEALAAYFADKDVCLLGIPDGLVDESGEVFQDYSADGVHFKKDGYVLWLNYLAAQTEG